MSLNFLLIESTRKNTTTLSDTDPGIYDYGDGILKHQHPHNIIKKEGDMFVM